MRASDADRERAAEVLREAHAEGRLSAEELHERLDAVFAARTYGELAPVTADLPAVPAAPGAPAPRPDPWRRVREPAAATVVLVGIWAITAVMSGSWAGLWFIWPVGIMWVAVVASLISGEQSRDANRQQRRTQRDQQRALRRERRDDRRGRLGR
jgi:uncharacterized membrane protein